MRRWHTSNGYVMRIGEVTVFVRHGQVDGWRLGSWEWTPTRGWFRWRHV